MMGNILHLPLRQEWFDLTKQQIKLEDYRELTPYWIRRLCYFEKEVLKDVFEAINLNEIPSIRHFIMKDAGFSFKHFTINHMTLGYPNTNDKSRHLYLEHEGIEIRTGNPIWGAKNENIYFVIKHGKLC